MSRRDFDDGAIVLGGSKPKMRVRASTGALTITVAGSAQHPRDPRIAVQERPPKWETFTPPPHTKWCSSCGDWVRLDGFADDPSRRDGKRYICKVCEAADKRRRYAEQVGRPVRKWQRRRRQSLVTNT